MLHKTKKSLQVLSLFLCWSLAVPAPIFAAEDDAEDVRFSLEDTSSDTISMSFDGALLKDVLLLFSQQSGLNFIASSDVESRKVTVYFENVSPQDALDSIVSANGLTYSKRPGSDIYMVTPANRATTTELTTKVIKLKYMRLSSSPLDVGGATTISNLSQSATISSDTTTTTTSTATTSTEKGVDRMVTRLLSSQGRLTQDIPTNSLIITDTADSIAAIEKVLAEVDVPPSQVILEVHIMEIEKSLASDIGLEWGGTDGALGTLSGGMRTQQLPFSLFSRQPQQYVSPDDFTDAEAVPMASRMSLGTIDATNFAATLHYIQTDSKTKILARPRVLTQNNEAAEIRLVTNQTIGTITTNETSTSGQTTTAERSDVGVTMRMTPQINDDGSVLLFVEPAVSTAASSAEFTGFSDVTTRSVRTMARIKNNETLVIGGLINGTDRTSHQKMPLLGDIPALGKLFRYDIAAGQDRELVVFVTPHIVYGASSLGKRSATAVGEDLQLKRMLADFKDREMDEFAGNFQDFKTNEQSFFTTDQQFIRDTEKRLSNPVMDKQMTQALDALSPQLIDSQMTQALDTFNTKKYSN